MANVLQWNQSTNSFSVSGATSVTPVVGEGIDNNFSVPQTLPAATSLGQAANLSQVGSYNGNTGNLATSTLPDTIWGQAVQAQTGATITLPTAQATPGSKVVMYGEGSFTVTCSGSQFIYCPAIGATSTTGPTPITVSDGGWIEITARSGGEFDLTGGSLLTFQNTAPSFTHVVSSPAYSATNSSTLAGTSSGSVVSSQTQEGVAKEITFLVNGYVNDTTTNQSVTFPVAFTQQVAVTSNSSGLTVSATLTALTITAPNATTAYNGVIIVKGG